MTMKTARSILYFWFKWVRYRLENVERSPCAAQEAMEGLQAPGSAVLVLHSTLVLRETTAPEDLQALQTALQSAIDRHCADACKALLKSAADLGVDVEGRMAGSPARFARWLPIS